MTESNQERAFRLRSEGENPRDVFMRSWKYTNGEQEFTTADVLRIINNSRPAGDGYHKTTAQNLVKSLRADNRIMKTTGLKYKRIPDPSGWAKVKWRNLSNAQLGITHLWTGEAV